MNSDDKDPVREALDPVMLEFGATVYICQIFEHSLCLVMALLAEYRNPSEGDAFRASFDFHSEKTLGGLIGALCKAIDIPFEFEKELEHARQLRNQVIHGYLVSANAMRLFQPKQRLVMIEELRTIRNNVRSVDRLVCQLIDEFLKRYGTSTEALKQQADRLFEFQNKHGEDFDPVH